MTEYSVTKQVLGLLGWLAITFVAAAIGGLGSADAGEFYAQLVRPDWAPPGWVFGPVWTALYAAMGVGAWLVWRRAGFRGAPGALTLYLVQLGPNVLWSWLFFAWQLGAWSFADVLLLWALVVATVVAFWRIQPAAAWLLIPYLLWVSFAAFLNFSVWQLNPQLLG